MEHLIFLRCKLFLYKTQKITWICTNTFASFLVNVHLLKHLYFLITNVFFFAWADYDIKILEYQGIWSFSFCEMHQFWLWYTATYTDGIHVLYSVPRYPWLTFCLITRYSYIPQSSNDVYSKVWTFFKIFPLKRYI